MNTEIKSRLRSIEDLLDRIRDATQHEEQKKRLAALEAEMSSQNFWDDRESAEKTIADMKKVKDSVQSIAKIATQLEDSLTLFELAEADNDSDSLAEVENDSLRLLALAESLELKTLLGGKYAAANAYIEIPHHQAGGNLGD